jgi:hypothetical protein
MKKKTLIWVAGIFMIVLAVSTTSCNRGYGCPTNFSLESK